MANHYKNHIFKQGVFLKHYASGRVSARNPLLWNDIVLLIMQHHLSDLVYIPQYKLNNPKPQASNDLMQGHKEQTGRKSQQRILIIFKNIQN